MHLIPFETADEKNYSEMNFIYGELGIVVENSIIRIYRKGDSYIPFIEVSLNDIDLLIDILKKVVNDG